MRLTGLALAAAHVWTFLSDVAFAHDIAVYRPVGAERIISDFHSRRGVNGLLRPMKHQGIDIQGKAGTPVIAAAPGRVLAADTDTCWGPTLAIDHGTDQTGAPLIALYGHLGDIDVRVGQQVGRGQLLGTLGRNHHRFDCIAGVQHLHFQLGRQWRKDRNIEGYGHLKYLLDGDKAPNPHLFWADGPGRITCFSPQRSYPEGTLTYPIACR